MNYIKELQARVIELENKLKVQEAAFNAFKCLLHGPKFIGSDLDGERKDWIATADVLNWLRDVQSEINNTTKHPTTL